MADHDLAITENFYGRTLSIVHLMVVGILRSMTFNATLMQFERNFPLYAGALIQ